MTNLTSTLEKLTDYLWKKVHITIGGEPENAFLFDLRKADPETLEWLLADTMDDLQPEALDLEYVIPFAVAGCLVGIDGDPSEYAEGKFHLGQFSLMLFANMKEGEGDGAPVYSIEVDGTIIPSTYKKVAEDVTDLDIGHGTVSTD